MKADSYMFLIIQPDDYKTLEETFKNVIFKVIPHTCWTKNSIKPVRLRSLKGVLYTYADISIMAQLNDLIQGGFVLDF